MKERIFFFFCILLLMYYLMTDEAYAAFYTHHNASTTVNSICTTEHFTFLELCAKWLKRWCVLRASCLTLRHTMVPHGTRTNLPYIHHTGTRVLTPSEKHPNDSSRCSGDFIFLFFFLTFLSYKSYSSYIYIWCIYREGERCSFRSYSSPFFVVFFFYFILLLLLRQCLCLESTVCAFCSRCQGKGWISNVFKQASVKEYTWKQLNAWNGMEYKLFGRRSLFFYYCSVLSSRYCTVKACIVCILILFWLDQEWETVYGSAIVCVSVFVVACRGNDNRSAWLASRSKI